MAQNRLGAPLQLVGGAVVAWLTSNMMTGTENLEALELSISGQIRRLKMSLILQLPRHGLRRDRLTFNNKQYVINPTLAQEPLQPSRDH